MCRRVTGAGDSSTSRWASRQQCLLPRHISDVLKTCRQLEASHVLTFTPIVCYYHVNWWVLLYVVYRRSNWPLPQESWPKKTIPRRQSFFLQSNPRPHSWHSQCTVTHSTQPSSSPTLAAYTFIWFWPDQRDPAEGQTRIISFRSTWQPRVLQPQLNSVYESGSLQSNLLVHSVIRMWKLDSISRTHQGAGSLSCPLPTKCPRHSLVAQEDTYRNMWDCQNWIRWAPITTKTTSVAGSRHTYAIQPSFTSSTLWRTATRTKTS